MAASQRKGRPVADHRTGLQKVWATVLGIVLLVGGVILAGIYFGNVPITVVGGIVAVIGLGLLRYALLRRRRLARG
jgi:MFS superfamily sulfate permease-like transporter